MEGETQMFAKYFNRNGYACPLDVLDAEEARGVRRRFDDVQEDIGKDNAVYSLHNKHLDEEWILQLATHPKLLAPLKALLGPNLILLDSRFICKFPAEDGEEAFVAWHQDQRYWGIDGDVVSVWLAVDDADEENGVMQVIPETHKSGLLAHVTETRDGNLLSSNQSIPPELYDASQAVHCCLDAGQMSLHHGHLVHGSDVNHSTRRRCGFVIRYVSTEAIPVEDPERPRTFPATVLACGVNTSAHFVDHAPAWYNRQ